MTGQHGFARNMEWKTDFVNGNVARFVLESDQHTRALWNHDFRLEYTVEVNEDCLRTSIKVENKNLNQNFDFTALLHTYLSADVSKCSIKGLKDIQYSDKEDPENRKNESQTDIIINEEVDRVYFNTPSSLILDQPNYKLQVTKEGFSDTVVWNPWIAKAKAMVDLPDNGYTKFVCIENGTVGTAVTLQAGQSWVAGQTIRVIK